jgi:predicted  nucleic acid-binding Zn-ribbon protein
MTDEQTNASTVECPNCGTEFSQVANPTPCPSCGKRFHRVTLSTTAKGYPDTDVRGIPAGRGKSAYFKRIQTGYEFFRKEGRWHLRERVIDRRNNRYREYITDADTGEVIQDKDQPLTDHVADKDLRKQDNAD